MAFFLPLVFSLFGFSSVSPAPLALAPTYTVPHKDPVAAVPFYSQFRDITSTSWQKRGCGIASLAMVINYYKPRTVGVDALLKQAVAAGAYQQNAGWIHSGLVSVSKRYGFYGTTYDLSRSDQKTAFSKFSTLLNDGPVIVSVHYKFDPKSTIPHLVVIDGIKDGVVYYNDPAAKSGQQQISVTKFLAAWKQRFIVIRPTEVAATPATKFL